MKISQMVSTTNNAMSFNGTTQRICVANASTELDEYTNAAVMGWGMTSRFN